MSTSPVIVEIKDHRVLVDAEDAHFLTEGRRWQVSLHGKVFYVQRKTDAGSTEYLHRLVIKAPPRRVVDHINGDGRDNRRANLRFATTALNLANSRPRTGQFKGVHWHTRSETWRAMITLNRHQRHIGSFKTELEAALAYDIVANRVWGGFSRLNFPDLLTLMDVGD